MMIIITMVIESLNQAYIKLPQLYLVEASSDHKDIVRIKNSFKSIIKELSIINYDNAVWDDTYQYVINRNPRYIESNFVVDAFSSINLNGIHIYNSQGEQLWGKTWDKYNWSAMKFLPFEQPSLFVKKNILVTNKQVTDNDGKPVTHAGFTLLNDKLVMYAATSIFHANLKGKSNGTMVFWRFVDNGVLADLQKRTGIDFTISPVKTGSAVNVVGNKALNVEGYRNAKGIITDYFPYQVGDGFIKFSYQAPTRQFDEHWFNHAAMITMLLFTVTLLIVSLLIHYFIIKPIVKAEHLVNLVIKNNDLSVRFNSERKDELGQLFYLINRLLDDVSSKEQELKSHNIHLQEISRTDGLTNIANRRAFDVYMKSLFENHANLQVSLLVCDVDYFKKFNDFYGHSLGDKALKLIAEALQKNIHQSTDFVARYGGEEFVVVLKNTNKEQALSVANNLLQSIFDLKISHKKSNVAEFVTLSIGVHSFVISPSQIYDYYFNKADEALYQAKNSGRNKACYLGSVDL